MKKNSMKRVFALLTVVFHLMTFSVANAYADGWNVVDAQGNVISQTDGNTTTVNVVDGNSYTVTNGDIAAGQNVIINILNNQGLIDATSKAIFNINDGAASNWSGSMNLTGIAAFLNAYGFNITDSFQANVTGGAILSTMGIDQAQFFAGVAELARGLDSDAAAIFNNGTFNVTENSFLALVAGAVRNDGKIFADGGAVVLAAGDQVKLDLSGGNGLISVAVEKAVDAPVYDLQGNKIADQISNSGTIRANGGIAILSAKSASEVFDNVINHSGIIEANSLEAKNGQIILDGGDKGIVNVTGTLNAKGDNVGETGGTIHVLGDKVGLFGGATVDVSGYAGGGTALIGGDYQGLGTVRTSSMVYVDPFAVVYADAILEGNGGKIIVWGNDSAQVHGILSAKGGELSGDGGFIETSSKGYLALDGIGINASAQNGKAGTWLIDPYKITLGSGGSNTVGGAFSSGVNSTVNVSDINSNLNSGTNVSITTSGADGDIELASGFDVSKTSGVGTVSFSLTATRDIILTGTIGAAGVLSGILNVVLNATRNIDMKNVINTNGGNLTATATTGDVTSTTAGDITTAGGILNFSGKNVDLNGFINTGAATLDLTATAGTITLSDALTTNNAKITLKATDDIKLDNANSDITTGGAAFEAQANTDNSGGGDYKQSNSGSSVTTSNGIVTITGKGADINGTINSGSGTITVTGNGGNVKVSNALTTNNADIALNATNDVALDGATADIVTGGGKFTVVADSDNSGAGNFTKNNNGSSVTTSGGNISGEAAAVDINGPFNSGAGKIDLTAKTTSVKVSNALTTTGGDVTLTAKTDVKLDDAASDIVTGGGKFTANADSDGNNTGDFNMSHAGSSITTSGGNVSVKGADYLQSGTINAGSGSVTLAPSAAGRTIEVGTSTTDGNFEVDDTEADLITAGLLTIGATDSGNMFVGNISPANTSSLVLKSGGSITDHGVAAGDNDGAVDVTVANLGLKAGGVIDLDLAIDKIAVDAGSTVDLNDANGFNVGTVGDVVGFTLINQNFTFTGGNLNFSAPVNLGTGTLTINSTGSVTSTNDGVADLLAQTINITSVTGIDVEVDATNLSFNNSTSGNVSIEDMDGGLTLTGATNGGSGVLTIITHSPLTIAANIIQAATINLTALESVDVDDNVVVNAGVTVQATGAGSDVNLSAGDNVVLSSTSVVKSDTDEVNITAGSGDTDNAGDISLAGNVDAATNASFIALDGVINQTAGTITVPGTLTVTTNTNDDVTLMQAGNDFGTITTGAGFVASLDIVDANSIILGNIAANSASTVTTSGNITQSGNFTGSSNLILNAGATNDITLDQANTLGGIGIISGRNVTINDTSALGFFNSTVSGTLNVTTNGTIFDNPANTLIVSGVTTLAAGAGNNITLNDANNNFSTVVITSGNDVTLNDTNAIDLGASTVSGNLNVTANGDITDSGDIVANGVGKTATFNAGAANQITLNSANNDFTSFASTSANNVIVRDVNAIDFGTTTVNNLNATAGGDVTDSGNLTIGTATITTNPANDITLDGANNFTNVVIGNGNDATINDTTGINFGTTSLTGNLTVTANGDITDSNNLTVAGNASFNSNGNAITLGDADDANFGSLTFNGGAVSVKEASATNITGTNTATSLVLESAGAITDANGTSINVTNNAQFNAGANAITLGDDAGDTTNFGSLILTGTDVTVNEDSATELDGVGATNFTLNSNGAITDDANNVVVSGTANFDANGSDVTLDNANDFGTVIVNDAGNATFNDANSINFGSSSIGGNLKVTTVGAIAQTSNIIADGLEFQAGTTVTLNDTFNDFNNVAGTSSGNIVITDSDDLTVTTVGAQSGLTSNGNLIDLNTGALTINNQINAGAGNVDIDSTGAVTSVDDATADIVGSTIDITATSIGGSAIDVTAATAINADTSASNGKIEIDSIGAMPVGTVNAGTGNVTLEVETAGDDMTDVNDGGTPDAPHVVNVTGGNIILNTNGGDIGVPTNKMDIDPSVSWGATTNGGSLNIHCMGDCPLGQVNVGTATFTFSAGGAITDANDIVTGEFNLGVWNITAGGLVLEAGTGIGALGNAIETRLSDFGGAAGTDGRAELDGGTGGVYLVNNAQGTAGLTLGGIGVLAQAVLAQTGIQILSGSPLTVAANVIDNGGGDIFLAALGNTAADDLTVNTGVTIAASGGNGAVSLVAGDSVALNGTAAITTAGSGEIELIAGEDATDLVQNQDGNAAGNVVMSATSSATTSGGTLLVDAGTDATVSTLNSGAGTTTLRARAGSINGADATNQITAATIDADAVTGIGNTQSLNTAASNVSADTTNGNIVINNVLGTAVNATSLTTGTGLIDFDQSGGGALTVTNATTGNGTITVNVDSANLDAVNVVAGGAGDVNLSTVTSGDIKADDVRANGNNINVTSAGAIEELNADGGADLRSDTMNLTAVTGIGQAARLEINAVTLTNASVSGTGKINLRDVNGGLNVTSMTTNDGRIQLDVENGDANITTMTAGGNNRNIDIETIGSGTVFVEDVRANNDVINITSAGAIEELGADAGADLRADSMNLTSVSGIGNAARLEINAVTLTNASVSGTGNINVRDTNNGLAVTSATTADGSITLSADSGNLDLTSVIAGGAGRNVNLSTVVSGDVNVADVQAAGDDITINSVGAIEELGADAAADLTSNTMTLNAATGIGAAGTLEIDAVTVTTANVSGAGAIDLQDVATGVVVTNATTNDGAITINAIGGDLTATNVVAGGAARNINLSTTTSGNILLGTVTAADDTATINSVGNINGINGANITTANTIDLDAVTGIGNNVALNTAASFISADSTNGNIDINNNLATNTEATSLTTGVGNINFDQTGGGNLQVTLATTGAGNITLTNTGADMTVVVATAGSVAGAGNGNIDLTTTTSGDIFVGNVTALDDTVNVTSAGEIQDTDAPDTPLVANITAGTINLNTNTFDIGDPANYLDISVSTIWNAGTNGGDLYVNCIGVCPTGVIDLGNGNGYLSVGQLVDANDDLFGAFNGGLVNLIAGGFEIRATNGIGSATDAIEMELADFGAVAGANGRFIAAGGTGGIFATNVGTTGNGLELAVMPAGLLTNVTADDDIIIFSGSPLTIGVDVIGGADITLSALGNADADDVFLQANRLVSSTGAGEVTVTAGDTVFMFAGSSIRTTGAGNVTVAGGEDFTDFTLDKDGYIFAGDVDMNATSSIRSEDGNILVDAQRSSHIAEVNADSDADNNRGDVIVRGRLGNVSDRNAASTNVTGDHLLIESRQGVGDSLVADDDFIETDINTLNVVNTVSGRVQIQEVAAGGNMDIEKADQQGPGDMTIRTNDGTLTVLAALAGGLGVSATSGITRLEANGAGANDDLVLNHTVTSTTGKIELYSTSNDVIADANGDVTATGGAEIEAQAFRSITMADGTIFNANGGGTGGNSGALGVGIDFDATNGDVTLGSVQTTSTASTSRGDANDAVSINALNGAVIDGGDSSDNIIANAGETEINTANGIGHGNSIETQIDRLDATNSTSNDIDIREVVAGGDLNVVRIDQNATTGRIDVQTGNGHLTVLSEAVGGNAGNGVEAVDGETFLIANGAGNNDDLVINNQIESATGKINLDSTSRDVTASAEGDVTATGGAEIESFAERHITMADGTVWDATSGGTGLGSTGAVGVGIDLDANTGDVTLGSVRTTSSSATSRGDVNDAVSINALNGAVIDGGDSSSNIIANSGETQIATANGIGHGNSIETEIDRLTMDNSTLNDIDIREVAAGGALNLVHVDQNAPVGRIDIQTLNGTLTVLTENVGVGAFTALGVAGLAGEVFLRANGAGNDDDLVINNQIETTTGKVNIDSSSRDVIADAEGDITATGGAEIESDAERHITMADGTIWNSNGGGTGVGMTGTLGAGIDLNARTGDITLGSVQTSSTADHSVVIVSNNGEIIDGGDSNMNIVTAPRTVGVPGSGGGMILSARNGIGNRASGVSVNANSAANHFATDAIDTQGGRLAAYTLQGDIQVQNTGAMQITTLADDDALTPQGSVGAGTVTGVMIDDFNIDTSRIFITTASPMLVSSNVTNLAAGNVTLYADGGTAADTWDLEAGIRVSSQNGNGDIRIVSGGNMTMAAGSVVSTEGDGVTSGTGRIYMGAGYNTNGKLADEGAVPGATLLLPSTTLFDTVGDATANFTMDETARIWTEGGPVNSGAGDILIDVQNIFTVGYVDADGNLGAGVTDGLRGNITTFSRNGSTIDAETPNVQNMDFLAHVLTMFSGNSIGTSDNPIEFTAPYFNAFAINDIFATAFETSLVNMYSVSGDISLTSSADVILGTAHATAGSVDLNVGGSIFANPGSNQHVSALNSIRLQAGGVIGTEGNPLNTILLSGGGTLFLSAGSSINNLSTNITGNFGPGNVQFLNTPPGLALFNGIAIGGDLLSDLISSTSQLYVNPLPKTLSQFGQFDGNFLGDFPGIFNLENFGQPVQTPINTAGLDTIQLPTVPGVPPVVPIPTQEQKNVPPAVVPIPKPAQPTGTQTTEQNGQNSNGATVSGPQQ